MWATELTAVDLHVSLRRHPALRGTDLSCSGGTTALVGPNGSGKSTLLRTIMGLTAATSGLIHVAGRTIPGELGKARDCSGHLPQRSSFQGVGVVVGVLVGVRRGSWGDDGCVLRTLSSSGAAPLCHLPLSTLLGASRA